MAYDPSLEGALIELLGLVNGSARVLGAYRRALWAEGFDEAEVWALVQNMESRLLDGPMDEAEVLLRITKASLN